MLRCRAIAKENKQFKETVETQERMIESQNFVMTNLRNGIDYLKATCKNAGTMYRRCHSFTCLYTYVTIPTPGEVQMNGCQWAEWAPWSMCSKTCGGGSKVTLVMYSVFLFGEYFH